MPRHTELLIIDPQNDFCDLPADWCPRDPLGGGTLAPALPVPGAHADLLRLARFIDATAPVLDGITITLDSHHPVDVAHPPFWQRADGGAVAPFTPITAAEVREGRYRPRDAAALPRVLAYLDALEARSRYTLMVWPVHCAIGSWGHGVHAAVRAAADRWAEHSLRQVHYVSKGQNPWTEHYSALQAEVPDPDDARTDLDAAWLESLGGAERILIAGEAGSHCVRATVEHLVEHLPGGRPERLLLLTDCLSPVSGFEAQQAAFLDAMRERGVRLTTSAEMQDEFAADARATA